jgi:methyl-accepting chemotaxis protein
MLIWFRNLRLRWKIFFAPVLLIAVLIGLGAYAFLAQRANQAAVDALLTGPVRQAEVVAEFSTAAWAAQARLYRLTATAANESDQAKIKRSAADTSALLATVSEKMDAIVVIKAGSGNDVLDRLQVAVTGYMKQAKRVTDMATSDAGAALMFMAGAERNFAQIEKLIDELTKASVEAREGEVAGANAMLGGQSKVLAGVVCIAVLVGLVVSLLVAGGIASPVVRIAAAIERIAQGDFEAAVPATDRHDEIGTIASAVVTLRSSSRQAHELRQERERAKASTDAERRVMLERLASDFEDRVKRVIDGVSQTAVTVGTNAGQVVTIAAAVGQRTATAGEAARSASAGVQAVAAASEEMLASIAEISRQAVTGRDIASQAVVHADGSDKIIRGLNESTQRIGEVVKLIGDIAAQTNLLALNATIEAARAGDAGRGFAIVASEVKALAGQTAQATKDIEAQIAAIQGATGEAVRSVETIAGVIRNVCDISVAIASAVEEQYAITRDITSNIEASSQGTLQVSADVGELDRATGETSKVSAAMQTAATSLAEQARLLGTTANEFLRGLRTA